MSIVRNRELSQFGSFIYIDDPTQSIGIATEATPYIGIGTPNPEVKVHIIGDTKIEGEVNVSGNTDITGDLTVVGGTIEASYYSINGIPLENASLRQWNYATNGTDIYRLSGNIGIGTSVFTQKLTVRGNISAGQFISTATSGTQPFVILSDTQVTNLNASFLRGKTPPSGDIVGTTDAQILTNKTLVSPIITGATFGTVGLAFSGSTSGNTILQASAVASGTLTLPAATDTLVARNTTDTLTNKTISAGSNTITGLTNSNLSGSAGITNTNLANSTISGISLGSNLNSLTFGDYLSSSGIYNGSTARTVSVAATSINEGNTIVSRDISGDFTAGTITATNFDSTSDLSVKENVSTFDNALETINNLRGVNFTWKKDGKPSIGVIAQELEEVLPQLVNTKEIKSVNYNGLIGVLVEAVKELSLEVQELKNQLNK